VFERIEYYYSSRIPPVGKFFCDDQRVSRLLESIHQLGVETDMIDVEHIPDIFEVYHKATVGPPFHLRAFFGEFRMFLPRDIFGRKLRALLCYEKAGDERPAEVFPRMDEKSKRVKTIEEALEEYLEETGKSRREALSALEDLGGRPPGSPQGPAG
jgi:hypothetical protein